MSLQPVLKARSLEGLLLGLGMGSPHDRVGSKEPLLGTGSSLAWHVLLLMRLSVHLGFVKHFFFLGSRYLFVRDLSGADAAVVLFTR